MLVNLAGRIDKEAKSSVMARLAMPLSQPIRIQVNCQPNLMHKGLAMFDFDSPASRLNTNAMKWDKYPDALPFWVADMDFSAPKEVLAALSTRLEQGALGYTLPPKSLNEQVVAWHQRRFNVDIKAEWIVWSPGVVPSFNVACRAWGQNGKVLVHSPNYPPMLQAPQLQGCEALVVQSKIENERWTLDFEQLEALAQDPKCYLFLLCHPANPIGTTFNEAELARIKAICAANNVLVCSDEIHADLVFSPQSHQPFMQDELGQQIGIGLFAPSKTFNIPGLGCSYVIIANPVLRKQYQQAAAGIVPWVNLLGYIACEAAYQYGEPWLEALLAYLKANRDYLFAELTSLPGIDVIKPEATYLMWFKLPESKQDAWAHFLAHGLAFSNGADFGQQGYLRWNYACSRKLLEQGVNQFKHALPLLGCADKR